LVGLGIGSLAAYGKPGQNFTYYEIDPDVVTIARDPNLFRFLTDCRAHLNIEVGDARIELAKAPASAYDLIVLDAFSSDSIPVHLLTREAVAMYLSKLAPGGVIAFHISNRYLTLQPVLASEAAALGVKAWVDEDVDWSDEELEANTAMAKFRSTWVVLCRSEEDLKGLRDKHPEWELMEVDPTFRLWTDDYSNLASVLKIRNRTTE
jgi:spermidine synthase